MFRSSLPMASGSMIAAWCLVVAGARVPIRSLQGAELTHPFATENRMMRDAVRSIQRAMLWYF
jgi:hypothetical protein